MRDFLADLLANELVVSRRGHPELAATLEHHRRRGELVSVLPGTYAAAGTERAMEIRVRALAVYDPDAVVTGWAAARIGFWPGPEPSPIVAAVKHRRAPQQGFVFCRRTIPLYLIRERSGVRFTDPALTAIDLADETEGEAIDQVLRTRTASLARLRHAVETTRHRRGQLRRRQLLLDSRSEPWSAAERRFHRLLREAGITGWKANLAVEASGRRCYLDVAFERLKLAIEVDGRRYHLDDRFEDDRHRQNALVLDGWTVLRITWAMIVDNPERVVREVRCALAACAQRARL